MRTNQTQPSRSLSITGQHPQMEHAPQSRAARPACPGPGAAGTDGHTFTSIRHRPSILHPPPFILVLLLMLLAAGSALAAVRYVDASSPSPTPPFTNWATAARVIQDAVDVAVAGDDVVVTNGTYATGGRAVYGTMTNRVAVDKPLTLRSVNGPEFTVIQGRRVPGTTNGDGAIRCVYLANSASLPGFTLTNGATRNVDDGWASNPESNGGGLWCESTSAAVSNCVLTGNSAYRNGGGVYRGTLNNCTLTRNSACGGGGACGGTLSNCGLSYNSAESGGGAYSSDYEAICTLDNCTLTDNHAAGYGGGAAGEGIEEGLCLLNKCIVARNSAGSGGGVYCALLNNCTLTGNRAAYSGGAAYAGRAFVRRHNFTGQ